MACHACGFEYDYRKRKCPQCGVLYKAGKETLAEEELDSQFNLKPVVEPASPTMDRQENLTRQLELAEEKKAILLKQKEVKELEDRLAAINSENAELEREIGSQPAGPTTKEPGPVRPKQRPCKVVSRRMRGYFSLKRLQASLPSWGKLQQLVGGSCSTPMGLHLSRGRILHLLHRHFRPVSSLWAWAYRLSAWQAVTTPE